MTTRRRTWLRTTAALAVVLALVMGACSSDDDSGSTDGTSEGSGDRSPVTLKLAGMGIAAQFPGAEVGAQARIQEFNDNAELEGVTLEWAGYANDNQDQATALSEARRLVSSEDVFALVGVTSQTVPDEFLIQQEVPWFGWAFDGSYCSTSEDADIWGFGWSGCLVNPDPPYMPDAGSVQYEYVKEKTGNDSPTAAVFGNDTESGRNAAKFNAVAWGENGFDIVLDEGIVAPPPVADYTPYVQQLLTSDNGSAPDVIVCMLAIDCIPIWTQLKAQNYPGMYFSTLYSDALVGALDGSFVTFATANFADPNAFADQMRAAVAAIDPSRRSTAAWRPGTCRRTCSSRPSRRPRRRATTTSRAPRSARSRPASPGRPPTSSARPTTQRRSWPRTCTARRS